MRITAFLVEDRTNLLAGVLALGLFGAGGVAVARQRGIAGVFLFLAGFTALMFLEYKHINYSE
jgi:uncharacterized membrane protein